MKRKRGALEKVDADLPNLQHKIRADPSSYELDFISQFGKRFLDVLLISTVWDDFVDSPRAFLVPCFSIGDKSSCVIFNDLEILLTITPGL